MLKNFLCRPCTLNKSYTKIYVHSPTRCRLITFSKYFALRETRNVSVLRDRWRKIMGNELSYRRNHNMSKAKDQNYHIEPFCSIARDLKLIMNCALLTHP